MIIIMNINRNYVQVMIWHVCHLSKLEKKGTKMHEMFDSNTSQQLSTYSVILLLNLFFIPFISTPLIFLIKYKANKCLNGSENHSMKENHAAFFVSKKRFHKTKIIVFIVHQLILILFDHSPATVLSRLTSSDSSVSCVLSSCFLGVKVSELFFGRLSNLSKLFLTSRC